MPESHIPAAGGDSQSAPVNIPPADTHTVRTVRGVNWNMLRVLIQTVAGLIVGVVLARLLPPEAFGLLATAMIFMGLAEIIGSMGMGAAVMQRLALSERQQATATSLSILMGTILALIVVALAPWLALLFNNPQVAPVLQVMALNLLISAAGSVPRGMIMRRLDFRRLFYIDLISYLAGYAGLTLLLAYWGLGVWSLVWGGLLSIALSSVLAMVFEPPRIQWQLARRDVASLLHFGGGMSLNSLINYCAANVDYLAIGKQLNQHQLGLYSRAYHLVTLPLNKIATTLTSVMFPAYAEIQADPQRVRDIYLRIVQLVSLLVFPVMISFAVAAEYVVVGLYGPNWAAAVPAFRVLALAGIVKVVFHLAGPVVQATGHVYQEVWRQAVYLLILSVGCFVVARHGIAAVAWVVVVGSLWLYLSMAQLVLKILGASWRAFLAAQWPGVMLALLVAAADGIVMQLFAAHVSAELMLALVILASALAFLAGFLFLPAAWVGSGPDWILTNYARKLPAPVRQWLCRQRA